jgi:DNA-binding MarR family transcriptional regulator
MATDKPRPRGPVGQLQAGMAFYAALGLDVSHFGPMWHMLKAAQLMENDLNRICAGHGVSLADFHLLGALMMEADTALRATDLALALNVSNAALTGRIARLAQAGLVRREADPADRRTMRIVLTPAGEASVRAVGAAIERDAIFVRHFRRMPPEQGQMLDALLAALHSDLERHFLPVSRGGSSGG